mgnify:CR=1 FL=1
MKSLPSGWKYSIGLIVSILLLFAANLWVGSVRIPAGAVWDVVCGHAVERESWRFILIFIRQSISEQIGFMKAGPKSRRAVWIGRKQRQF